MKKIFYSFILLTSLFLFSNSAEALECLYESEDGDKVYLYQYSETGLFGAVNYKASVRSLGPISMEDDGKQVYTSTGFYAAPAYNNDKKKEWNKIDTCPGFLRYEYNGGEGFASSKDKAYVCDKKSDCGNSGELFYLTDLTVDQTPDNVSLNEMFCSYSMPGTTTTYNFKIEYTKEDDNTYSGGYYLFKNYNSLYPEKIAINDLNPHVGPVEICDSGNGETTTCTSYYDGFSIRIFWNEENNYYKCPDSIAVAESKNNYAGSYITKEIHIGYKDTDVGVYEVNVGGFLFLTTHSYRADEYKLDEGSSYIQYDINSTDSNMCVYTRESDKCNNAEYDCGNEKSLTLIERKYIDGRIEYFSSVNLTGSDYTKKVTTNVDIKELNCDKLPVLYTNCLKSANNDSCIVSDKQFEGAEKVVTDKYANTQDSDSALEGMGNVNGYNYKKYMCELSGRLQAFVSPSVLRTTENISIYYNKDDSDDIDFTSYNITNLDCETWGFSSGYNCVTEACKSRIVQITTQKITEIKNYCNLIFNRYIDNSTNDSFIQRKEECIDFHDFYNSLVEKGIINDLAEGCGFVTNDLADKLVWILDLIKIAGPILALGLGTLDFIKVIANGDSDKEMKNAFKRFSIRILSAFLLFILPIILAFLLDIFIGNQDGYDPDNPFCDVIDIGD